ncbi:MAG TPA: endonuclease III [Candidatus Onthoplasma faecigallinarum]|nr:endonuclease III [Candidatus Onthoplasma faecigallinarum]
MTNFDKILSYFDELFPDADCALNFSTPYELLIAVILSAQCTDKRVNVVTKDLFKEANTPEKMLQLGEEKLKQIIFPCGFYNNKAKAILKTSRDLIERFDGNVPSDLETLTTLDGVGRKTANVVIANAFGGQTIAVDTHVHRVSKRLGLTKDNSTPYQCEMDLLKIVPYDKRSKFHHQMILFGRNICKAIKPNCEICKLKDVCKYYKNVNNKKKG